MVSSPRGLALVISNVSFDPCAAPDLDSRKGGEVDEEVLRKVFTELDYIVTVRRDLTAQVTHTQSKTVVPKVQQCFNQHGLYRWILHWLQSVALRHLFALIFIDLLLLESCC